MIDILYLAFNRIEFTRATLEAMRENTDWSQVRRIVLCDDGSTDGTARLISNTSFPCITERIFTAARSPVSIMNKFIIEMKPAEIFAKIDNDTMLPPGWLEGSLSAFNSGIDLLGIEARDIHSDGAVSSSCSPRTYTRSDFIGGIGLMRTSCFKARPLPTPNGRFGFTKWQEEHPEVKKGWLYPSLPVFLLDHLPMEPWETLSREYLAKGWQRQPWGNYPNSASFLWKWFTTQREALVS